jgi:hypothetical protein
VVCFDDTEPEKSCAYYSFILSLIKVLERDTDKKY